MIPFSFKLQRQPDSETRLFSNYTRSLRERKQVRYPYLALCRHFKARFGFLVMFDEVNRANKKGYKFPINN